MKMCIGYDTIAHIRARTRTENRRQLRVIVRIPGCGGDASTTSHSTAGRSGGASEPLHYLGRFPTTTRRHRSTRYPIHWRCDNRFALLSRRHRTVRVGHRSCRVGDKHRLSIIQRERCCNNTRNRVVLPRSAPQHLPSGGKVGCWLTDRRAIDRSRNVDCCRLIRLEIVRWMVICGWLSTSASKKDVADRLRCKMDASGNCSTLGEGTILSTRFYKHRWDIGGHTTYHHHQTTQKKLERYCWTPSF